MATRAKGQKAPATPASEVANYDIVNHWFDLAADRIGLRDDIRAVMRSSYLALDARRSGEGIEPSNPPGYDGLPVLKTARTLAGLGSSAAKIR